jgi:phage-related protein
LFINTTFEFDGQQSTEYGLLLANMSSSVMNTPFAYGRQIREERVNSKSMPYFFGIDEEPLQFRVMLARQEEWDYNTRLEVVRWLFQDTYKPFVSTDHIGIIYNAMVVDSPEKISVGNIPRMIELNFRCDAPWAWTPFYVYNYDLSTNPGVSIITIENKSNIQKHVSPEIWIRSIEGGTIKLKNTSDGGREAILVNLLPNEVIYLNNEFKQIETDRPSVYRLKDFNRKWIKLVYGMNHIEVTGKCLITSKAKYGIAV